MQGKVVGWIITVLFTGLMAGCLGPGETGTAPSDDSVLKTNPSEELPARGSGPFPNEWTDCIKERHRETCFIPPDSDEARLMHVPGLKPVLGKVDGSKRPLIEGDIMLVRVGMPQQSYRFDSEGQREAIAGYVDWVAVDLDSQRMRPLGNDWFSSRNSVVLDGDRIAYSEIPLYPSQYAPQPHGRGAVFVLNTTSGVEVRVAALDDKSVRVVSMTGDLLLLDSWDLQHRYSVFDLETGELQGVGPAGIHDDAASGDFSGHVIGAGFTSSGIVITYQEAPSSFTIRHIGFDGEVTFEKTMDVNLNCRLHSFEVSDRLLVASWGHTWQGGGCPDESGSAVVHDTLTKSTWTIPGVHFGSINGRAPASPVTSGENILYGLKDDGQEGAADSFLLSQGQSTGQVIFEKTLHERVQGLALDDQTPYFVIDRNIYTTM